MKSKLLVLATSVAITTAHAAETHKLDYGFNVGVGQSDNLGRTAVDEHDETVRSAGFNFIASEKRARLTVDAAADLAYLDYATDLYNDELVGNASALATLTVVEDRFDWFFQENFGQVRRDPLQAVTPANRENINYASTGPVLKAHLGQATEVRLAGRYARVDYERSAGDNDRYGGVLSLTRRFSSVSLLSVNLEDEKTDYRADIAGADYTRHDIFLGYVVNASRTRATLDLGYSILSRSGPEEDGKGLLARFEVRRQVGRTSTVSLRLGHQFSDASDAFLLQQGFGSVGLDTQSTEQTRNPFTSQYVNLAWDAAGRRTGLGLSVSAFKEAYEELTALDRNRALASAYVYRNFTPALRLQLSGGISRDDFTNGPGDARESNATAEISWRLGRKLALAVAYERYVRNADDASTDYRENRGWLRLSYGTQGGTVLSPSFQAKPMDVQGGGV